MWAALCGSVSVVPEEIVEARISCSIQRYRDTLKGELVDRMHHCYAMTRKNCSGITYACWMELGTLFIFSLEEKHSQNFLCAPDRAVTQLFLCAVVATV